MPEAFKGYDVMVAREELDAEENKRRQQVARAAILEFGDDTFEVGTTLKITKKDTFGEDLVEVFFKQGDNHWQRTSGSSLKWRQLVDWALTSGAAPSKRSDFVVLVPEVDTEADVNA